MAMANLIAPKQMECEEFLTQLLVSNGLDKSFPTFATRWRRSELEGEIIDTLSKFLHKIDCPAVLMAPLIALLWKKLSELDLTSCKLDSACNSDDFDPAKVSSRLLELFKTICSEVKQNLSILSLMEIGQPTHVNVHAIKNSRRKMEDQHVYYQDINTLFGWNDLSPGQSMFAVFDGHGGTEAAYYAAAQLICQLKSCSNLLADPGEALKQAIMEVDKKFVEKASQDKLKSGCTAVVVLIQGAKLTVGWLGDSQVVLCKDGQAIQLMEPHTPDREDEQERIQALGGTVLYVLDGWRVNGQLSVSRAIGDIGQKPHVTGEPDTEEYEMEGDEEFLILACDGLWDTVEPLEAVECVQNCISGSTRDEAAEKLVSLAKEKGSLDNITVMVVYLDFNNVKKTTEGQCQEVS